MEATCVDQQINGQRKCDISPYAMGILYSQEKWRIGICCTMDGPRDYTQWKTHRKKIIYDITYMWNAKIMHMNCSTK